MPPIFWTGKISFTLKVLLNTSNLIAWITGNARDITAMKQRMKNGYNGKCSDFIHRYDELGLSHYIKISNKLIEKVDCKGKTVIDVGCGTGILSLTALKKGTAKLTCVDISKLMLDKCKEKIVIGGDGNRSIDFCEADAEKLPFEDNSFDVVLSNMILGMIPNQQETIAEMTRVLKLGGTIALSAHGPAHYMEAIEAGVRSMNLRYFLGHRMEFWPRDEKEMKTFFVNAGLTNIQTVRLTWRDSFQNGRDVFDFFASTSSLWWYDRLPVELREKETEKTIAYFQRREINSITSDVVIAYGKK